MIDPEKIARVAEILREEISGAEVDPLDSGDLGPAVFNITTPTTKGACVLRVSYERFEEDQADTEKLVREAVSRLGPGESWLLRSDGELVPFP